MGLKNIVDKAIMGFQAAVKSNEAELKACQCTTKFDALKRAIGAEKEKAAIQKVARDDAIKDLTQKAAENEQIENEIQTSTAQIESDRENFKNTAQTDSELIKTRMAMSKEADKKAKEMFEEIKKDADYHDLAKLFLCELDGRSVEVFGSDADDRLYKNDVLVLDDGWASVGPEGIMQYPLGPERHNAGPHVKREQVHFLEQWA